MTPVPKAYRIRALRRVREFGETCMGFVIIAIVYVVAAAWPRPRPR